MAKVSVCMITYNHEKFIEQAINSVLEQDVNFEYEIVVGEDCSEDTTASVLRELERKNQNRIRVIYRPANLGGKANFINTLSMCNGEYVAFLEGDDYWTSNNKLQRQVDFLESNKDAAGVFHRTRVINGKLAGLPPVLPAVEPPELFSLDFLAPANQFAVSSLLARRACLTNIDAWCAKVSPGDWALFMMLATHGDLGFIPLEMSHYRVHAAGNWVRLSRQRREVLSIQMLMWVMRLVSGKDQELIDSSKSRVANSWSSELVANTSVSIEAVINELNEIADFQLSNYLVAQVVAAARAKGQAHEDHAKAWEATAARASSDAKVWEAAAVRASSDAKAWEAAAAQAGSEAKAWEAAAAQASSEAKAWEAAAAQASSEAKTWEAAAAQASSEAKAWEAAAAQASSEASEASNAREQLMCTVQELHANTAELKSENEHLRALISKHERDSQRTKWLLKRLGDKIRHFPRDLSRHIRASGRKQSA